MGLTVKVGKTGIAGLTRGMRRVLDTHEAERQAAIRQDLDELADILTRYPDLTLGNSPPHTYWERGVGRQFASGKVNPRSQQFGGNAGATFTKSVTKSGLNVTGILQTSVEYADLLIDDELQTTFHKDHGWRSVSVAAGMIGIDANIDSGKSATGAALNNLFSGLKGLFSG